MKEWYTSAFNELVSTLSDQKRVNGLEFLEDFVLNYREMYFENIELYDVDTFVSDEFSKFQTWLSNEKNDEVRVGRNGKWYSPTEQHNVTQNQAQPATDFTLSEKEKTLLSQDALGLSGEKTKEFKTLYQKLASTNHHDIKYKCAHKLAKCAELNREVHENELVEYWLNASDAAAY